MYRDRIGRRVGARRWVAAVLAALMVVAVGITPAGAVPTSDPRAEHLLEVEPGQQLGRNSRYADYGYSDATAWNWASTACSSYGLEGATIRLVSACTAGQLLTTVIDPEARTVVSRKVVSLTQALPIIGAVKHMSDGNIYVLSGQDNPSDSTATSVVRVSKFSTDLAHLGSASISSGNIVNMFTGVRYPFDAGSPDMALTGTDLYVHASREMPGGHQANFTLHLDTAAMNLTSWPLVNYSSHSFSQKVAIVAGKLVTVDHGDAYPRALRMTVVDPVAEQKQSHTLLGIEGEAGANWTGVTLGNLVSNGTTAAVVGTSTPYGEPVQGVTGKQCNLAGQCDSNVYFAAVDVNTGARTFAWVTNNHPVTSNTIVGQANVVALADGNYAVFFHTVRIEPDDDEGPTWDRSLEYRLVSPTGAVLAGDTYPGIAWLPTAPPVQLGTTLYWISAPQRNAPLWETDNDGTEHYLFGLDITNPVVPQLLQRTGKYFTTTPTPTLETTYWWPRVGETLTAKPGKWSPKPDSLTYQWRIDGQPVAGETGKTFTPPTSAAGTYVDVVVTAKRAGYFDTPRTSRTTYVRWRVDRSPTLTGNATVGSTLKVDTGLWVPSPASATIEWRRGNKKIAGATGTTYRVTKADLGKILYAKVEAKYILPDGTTWTTEETNRVQIVRTFTKKPKVTLKGKRKAGKILTARVKAPQPAPDRVTYRWLRGKKKIKNATGTTYKIRKKDRGKRITVKVVAKKKGYLTVKVKRSVKVKRK